MTPNEIRERAKVVNMTEYVPVEMLIGVLGRVSDMAKYKNMTISDVMWHIANEIEDAIQNP